MTLDETQARKILLAQAMETSGLLSDADVDRVDDEASQLAQIASRGTTAMEAVLAQRADILIAKVRPRHPALVASLEAPWLPRGTYWVPLLALVLGFGADRVANPHRVDLLSAPILVLLVWNLVVYAVLLASLFRRPAVASGSFLWGWRLRLQSWGSFLGRRTNASAASRASTAFLRLWQPATSSLSTQRLTALMHIAAAAWALGIVLSLLGRGLFVAYGVGWESTWLDAEKLHVFLSALFAPLVALLPLEPFTLGDIARLQLGTGAGGELADGRRWALMYAGLLALLIIFPRLLLAVWASVRAHGLSQRVGIDLDDPYFQRIIDNLFPAQVRLGVLTHRAVDQTALERVLQHVPAPGAHSDAAGAVCLMDTARGDGLWWDRLPARVDMVLHVVGQAQDLALALPQLQSLGRPVLMLVRASDAGDTASDQLVEQCRQHIRSHELPMEVLDFADFAACWAVENVLLEAIARRVPRARARGMVRLQAAWQQRNLDRFAASVQTMADTLRGAASEHEAIPRLSVVERVQASRVREHKAAKEAAMARVQQRVRTHFDRLLLDLLRLHGLDAAAADELVFHAEAPEFAVSGTFGARDAAMGGAASGAAVGASVDLLTGGLTLGAATALGALAGGSAALIGTVWNNRDTPDGRVRIALGDEMLLALVQACVLRYLAVIHVYRDSGDLRRADQLEAWKAAALAQGVLRRKALLRCLDADSAPANAVNDVADALRQMTAAVLQALYPGARIPPP